jgi:uncharacterized protein YpmS
MENNSDKAILRNNPLFIITLACLIAIGMFLVSFITYYHSDTKKTIEQLQANNQQLANDEKTSPVLNDLDQKSIEKLRQNLTEQIQAHNDDVEFSSDELTDSALGL